MDGKFHFIVFLLFIRYAISQKCDCKLVDILRNIVQREMMEREMLVSRVEMLESKQGSGTSNGAGSSGYSSEANILKRLSVIETMIENINTKLKETTTERQNGGRLYSALTDAWRIHKHALWITNENIENKINDNNNRFNQLTREAEKSIEVVELKVESLINQTNEKASKQLKEVEDRVEVIHVGLNKTFKDYTTQMNTDFTRFVNKTDRMLNEISSDECASDPCKNGATCVDGIQRYTCICMTGYGGSQCQIDQSNQKVDGGWNVWGPWSGCSASCNTGMESRNRACSNPKPSNGGDHCIGESAEYRLCNKFECPGTGTGFSIYNPVLGTGEGSTTLKFSYVVENSAGAFNMTTGEFVCRQSGLYFFTNTVARYNTATVAVYCYFYKNDVQHGYVAGYAADADPVNPSGTNSILYHLRPGDTVSIRNCGNSKYIDHSSSFTGFLVHADD